MRLGQRCSPGEDTTSCVTILEVLTEGSRITLALYSYRYAVSKHIACKPETASEATQFIRSLQELGIGDFLPLSAG